MNEADFIKIVAERCINGKATTQELLFTVVSKNCQDTIKSRVMNGDGFTKAAAERYLKNEATHADLLFAICQDTLFLREKNETSE